MTAIGRALMSRPRLLLDKPSMGLAPLVVEHIFRALPALTRNAGLAVLVAEQNGAVALRHADRAVALENGRSAPEGDARSLAARSDVKAFYLGHAPIASPIPQCVPKNALRVRPLHPRSPR